MMLRLACIALSAGCLLTTFGCAEKIAPTVAQAVEPERKAKAPELQDNPFRNRVKAPALAGGVAWINTAGPLELEQLHGKFVLLDFWTYCCINCMHILPELKKIEHKYANDLVVIGVHSAKFEAEEDSANITEAVMRYEIQHPVVNDAHHAIWDRFGVNSWPSMFLIDPEGYVIWGTTGETTFASLDAVLTKAVAYYRRKGLLDETPLHFDLAASKATDTPLRYPGKVLADDACDRLFIADSNHNRIVITKLDGTLIDVIGNGQIGTADGDYTTAKFNHPQGMALDGETLYVADTENHLLRKVDLAAKTVKTIAGRGIQARPTMHELQLATQHRKPKITALNSPWDLWIHGKNLYIAMAGPHQIWKMPLDESEIAPYAGNGREDIVDGPLLSHTPYEMGFSSFAQPSGLTSDGTWLYVADSEGSSIRAVPFDPRSKVKTIVGTAGQHQARLFTFGDIDGHGDKVRLQHPLGVAWYGGKLYVADTYNSRVKELNVDDVTSTAIAGMRQTGSTDAPDGLQASFDEPAGISAARGTLYLADTNNHRIRTIDVAAPHAVRTIDIAGLEPPKPAATEATPPTPTNITKLPPAKLRATNSSIELAIAVQLPTGWKINPFAPMRYKFEQVNKDGVVDRSAIGKFTKVEPPSRRLSVRLPVTGNSGEDHLRVTLQYYYCQEGNEGLCKASSVTWDLPITLAADAESNATTLSVEAK